MFCCQRVFGISLPLIKNILPKECHITTVVGAPIEVPKIEEPSKEQVQEYLDKYIDALTKVCLCWASHPPFLLL